MKEVFNKYKTLKDGSDVIPILLINEADAILSKRISVTSSIDQMNNTMQNILLEEMENFDGILFATTNLVPNLDSAFERRFLYKIEYTPPQTEARFAIWESHFPELDADDLKMLAENFMLSGGQIENIVRKTTLNNLLYGNAPDIEEIFKFCLEESSLQKTKNSIGFMACFAQSGRDNNRSNSHFHSDSIPDNILCTYF
jgi:SpoVK/Ycf46/Vps4 family AAA+-type ATPase